MFAIYATLYATHQGDIDTEYVIATFDRREDARIYLNAYSGCKNHPNGYSIRAYQVPPHNPPPHREKTEEERRQEQIAVLEEQLKTLKGLNRV